MKQGLILVDIQNDYFTGGSMALVDMEKAASNCQRLLDHFRRRHAPLFHIQHIATRQGATFFIPGTPGCEIHDSVRPADDEPVVVKHFPNSFRDTTLDSQLKESGIEEVIICGAMTHMCIDTTTRAAFDLGYACHVISDACATRDLAFEGNTVKAAEVQSAFMAALSVPFAKISRTDDFLGK